MVERLVLVRLGRLMERSGVLPTTQFIPYLLTWILGVASKQLRLLHPRVGDSTTVGKFLEPSDE